MAIAREKGDLTDRSDTGACEHPAPHKNDAVARVQNPNQLGAAGISLCAYHLALWTDIHGPEMAENANVTHLIPDDALLHLDDLPATRELAGFELDRVGIDHSGRGHYLTRNGPDGALLTIEVNADGSIRAASNHYQQVTVDDYLTDVLDERGWMLLDDDYAGFNRGDSQ